MQILLWAIPLFVITMLIERQLTRDTPHRGYWPKDTATNLGMGIGNLVVMFVCKGAALALYFVLYEYRLFELPTDAWWYFPALILCDDFFYYWFHRSSHMIRLFWAAHVNHHSATSYNLSTALRQTWTGPLITWVFWLPMPLLGFHPLMVVLAQSISLLYQYWIHTEVIDDMGPYEWVFNTPSHHRVHHGTNPLYLDRNHGGILILWDRIFGTFEPERERPNYGLTQNLETYNLLTVAFHEWQGIGRDVLDAKTWRGRFGYLFGPPGWREDGTGKTSRMLRAQAIQRALDDRGSP
jgi:sterol desaturase/sphingolipid hydroxylase (fatty acid hydroxylase superfamily)